MDHRCLDVEEIPHSFEEIGYFVVPQLLPKATVVHLAEEARMLLGRASENISGSLEEEPRLHNILAAGPEDSGPVAGRLSLHIEHVFRFSELFKQLVHDERVTAIARAVCDGPLRLLDDQLYWKPRGVGGATYIHRDSDFFGPLRVVTVWMPLCDVNETNGCLWAIPRSHRPGIALPGLRRRTAAPLGSDPAERPVDFFYEVDWDLAGFVPLQMHAGDALLLHRDVVHYSRDVQGDHERLSYLIEYFNFHDFDRYRHECAGLFEYHGRWRHMMPVGGAPAEGEECGPQV